MRSRDKILILVLGIMIFVNIGAIACTYYSTGVIDLILVIALGSLVFVDSGVIVCSRNNGGVAQEIT